MRCLLSTTLLVLAGAGTSAAEELYATGFAARKLYHLRSGLAEVETIPLPGNPFDAALTADGAFLYVSHPGAGAVSVVRTTDDVPTAMVPAGSSPAKMAIGNADTRLYVTCNAATPPHIVVIDITRQPSGARKNVVVGSIDLTPEGCAAASTVAAFGQLLAVGTQGGQLLLYETSTLPPRLLGKRHIGARVNHVLFSPAGMKIYALLAVPHGAVDERGRTTPAGNVHVLRSESLETMAVLPAGPSELKWGIVVQGTFIYVTDVWGRLHVIDVGTDTLVSTTKIARQLAGLAASDTKVFVADPAAGALHTIVPALPFQPARLVTSTPLGSNAAPVALAVLSRHRGLSGYDGRPHPPR